MQRATLESKLLCLRKHSWILPVLITIGFHTTAIAAITTRVLIDPAGENDGDKFGSSVAGAGDVNADGYDDLIIGANYYPTLSGRGRAYIYFGGPGIDSVADLVIPTPAGNNIGWFGISVAGAGDVNGDGYPDVIVGARYSGLPGKAFLYYGGPSLDANPDLTLTGESTGSSTWFGSSVAGAGDLNGDGFSDVIVGAPVYGTSSGQVGRAYVYYGGSVPDAIPDRVFTGAAAGDQLGSSVGSAGDMNGDGYPDVFASAPYNDAAGTDAGAVYVWFGGPSFDASADLTIRGSAQNELLRNAANAGDLNTDGYSDLIVSENHHAKVFFGGSAGDVTPDLTLTRSNVSVAGAGDVNGDGVDDFVLGDPNDDTGGTDAGRVSVYYGGSGLDPVEDLHLIGDRPGRRLGESVAGMGRVDGPGPEDLIASAAEDPEGVGYDSGRVYVFANAFESTAVPSAPLSGIVFLGPRPNPARSVVNLDFVLAEPALVQVTVYDVAGREIARPVSNERMVGRVTRIWRPQAIHSGLYYMKVKVGNREQVRKLTWLSSRP